MCSSAASVVPYLLRTAFLLHVLHVQGNFIEQNYCEELKLTVLTNFFSECTEQLLVL